LWRKVRFIGAVTALVDLSLLFAQLNGHRVGRTGRRFLVRDDGLVIPAPGVTPGMKLKSEEYAAIRDTMGMPRGREARYIYANLLGAYSCIASRNCRRLFR
jgi:hypothetical protein